jgi:hypothetical protein
MCFSPQSSGNYIQMSQGAILYLGILKDLAVYTVFADELTNQVILMFCIPIFELKYKEWSWQVPDMLYSTV